LETAQAIAQAQRLDFLEFADDHGKIISSAQWPAKFGYDEPLIRNPPIAAFLKEEELPSGASLGLFAIKTASTGDRKLYVIGGIRLDKSFLATLEAPADMSISVYENLGSGGFSAEHLISTAAIEDAQQLAPIIQQTQGDRRESGVLIHVSSGDESVHSFPLTGENGQVLGVLLITSSRQIYTELRDQIRSAALLAG